MFRTISRNTQGVTAHHIFKRHFRHLWSAEEYEKNYKKPVHFRLKRAQYNPVDEFDEVVIKKNVQEFYTHRHKLPSINNLLLVLKTDIMSTIHQN